MQIRPAMNADHDAIWNIFHEILVAGDTYAFDPQMPRQEALAYWFRADTHTYVAEEDGGVVGTYILRPNQSGPGSHVANAAFMVAPAAGGCRSGTQNGRALLERGAPNGFSRHAIQFRDLHEHASDPSLETAWFQNCRHFARRISPS
jgi:L-amino acid N-acyltransferase YncA